MQRAEPEGIVISCDFCRRDWDGAAPMIEGHRGSILCLECCQKALQEQAALPDKYACTLCLRFNIPAVLPRWRNPQHPEAIACQECLYQAARAFSRNKDVDFTFDATHYPPSVKPPSPGE
jgi:hypothetical protein